MRAPNARDTALRVLVSCRTAGAWADAALRARIGHSLQINETGEIGPFAIEALIAAYDEGAEWLDALNEYLHGNYRFSREYFDRNLPQYPVLPLEGTYLVWVDCRASGLTSDELETKLLEEAKLRINPGAIYGLSLIHI